MPKHSKKICPKCHGPAIDHNERMCEQCKKIYPQNNWHTYKGKRKSSTARGYDKHWEDARAAYLKYNPLCVVCNRPATVVDHVIPHRGVKTLFWSRDNWQALCAKCHNSKTGRGE